MPRHDRAYGIHYASSSGGGNVSRRTRGASPYDDNYRRENWRMDPNAYVVIEAPRQGGSTPKGGGTPQTPKPNPKGGSKPGGTVRRRTRVGA